MLVFNKHKMKISATVTAQLLLVCHLAALTY